MADPAAKPPVVATGLVSCPREALLAGGRGGYVCWSGSFIEEGGAGNRADVIRMRVGPGKESRTEWSAAPGWCGVPYCEVEARVGLAHRVGILPDLQIRSNEPD